MAFKKFKSLNKDKGRAKASFILGNIKGMSIVGAVMASVIGLIVMGGITNILTRLSVSSKKIENTAYQTDILSTMISYLQDQDICTGTFRGKTSDDEVTALKRNEGGTI